MLSIWTELWIKETIEDRVLKASHGKCVSSSLASALRTGRLMLSGRQRELCASKLPGEFEVGILRVQGKCLKQESQTAEPGIPPGETAGRFCIPEEGYSSQIVFTSLPTKLHSLTLNSDQQNKHKKANKKTNVHKKSRVHFVCYLIHRWNKFKWNHHIMVARHLMPRHKNISAKGVSQTASPSITGSFQVG